MSPPRKPGEFELIAAHFAPLARKSPGALGLTDDAAFLDPEPDKRLVVTADAAIEGIHFRSDDPPELIGRKVLRFNLSDLASMGADPVGYLMTIAMPEARRGDWLGALVEGLAHDQDEFGLGLLGGDTTASPGPVCISITALGQVPAGGGLFRSGARAGDLVFVSGTIGDGALGLKSLNRALPGIGSGERGYLEDRYLLPRPRLALGRALHGLASAAIDVSDGLVADAGHICEASRLAAVLRASEVPLSDAAGQVVGDDPDLFETAISGGDDYELLFTAAPEREAEILAAASGAGVEVRAIGEMTAGEGVSVFDRDGRPLELASGGFAHF